MSAFLLFFVVPAFVAIIAAPFLCRYFLWRGWSGPSSVVSAILLIWGAIFAVFILPVSLLDTPLGLRHMFQMDETNWAATIGVPAYIVIPVAATLGSLIGFASRPKA